MNRVSKYQAMSAVFVDEALKQVVLEVKQAFPGASPKGRGHRGERCRTARDLTESGRGRSEVRERDSGKRKG